MKAHSWSATLLLLLVTVTLGFETAFDVSAQTSTPTPTRTATPTNPNDTLEIDLGDDFSPDLVADISIGTAGNPQSLECGIDISNGVLFYNDSPVTVDQIPDFRTQLPSICSDAQIKGADIRVYAPNGNRTGSAIYTFTDPNDSSHITYVAALPLGAVLTPGDWRISISNPVQADLIITMPRITSTIFFRGALTTGVLAGFQSNELVRAFVYEGINGGQDGWRFTKSFEFSVNQYGYRFISLAALQRSTIIFIGQQGSNYITNAAFTDNGINDDPSFSNPAIIQRVWSAPSGSSQPPTANPNVRERTDAHGVVQVYVPQGCFMMGSDTLGDLSAQIKGHSQRLVCLTHSYWIDKYEVSNAQWEQFRLESGSPLANLGNFRTSTQADTPRVGMTLQQAEAYALWRGGSIPTEAEWEYAARGPNAPLYPWGDVFTNQANVYGVANGTVSVPSYPAGVSWVGAYNMAGNAGEWVSDCYNAAYDAQKVQYDPVGPCDGSSEMVKGSSFAFNNLPAQSAYRFVNPPGKYWFDVGLRVISPAN